MLSLCPQVDFILKDDDDDDDDCIQTSDVHVRPIIPRLIDFLDDGLGDISPVVLIGYRGKQPIYRVTNTFATEWEGVEDGQLEVHWPALFPNLLIPICQPLQLDVTFRNYDPFDLDELDENDDDEIDYNDEWCYYDRSKYSLMWSFDLDHIRWWE